MHASWNTLYKHNDVRRPAESLSNDAGKIIKSNRLENTKSSPREKRDGRWLLIDPTGGRKGEEGVLSGRCINNVSKGRAESKPLL